MGSMNKGYIIRDEPLTGRESIRVGSRIVVWDHRLNIINFAGKITRVNFDMAIGENYACPNMPIGTLCKRTIMSFTEIGLVPTPGTKDDFNPRFRTYAMPEEAAPFEHKRFRVMFKTPEQIKMKEDQAKMPTKPKAGARRNTQ
jgi:hypothetical protein